MVLVPMRQLLEEAECGGYAVGAFNINNMEQADGIFRAAAETNSPFIIQVSKNALRYAEPEVLTGIVKEFASHKKYSHIPVALHLDHGVDHDVVEMAINAGCTSVMIDGSLMPDGKMPSSIEYNTDITRRVVDYAHRLGVTVEGEIGVLGGIEDGVGAGRGRVTDPNEAKRFVEATGVDALALAIGTSHGAYKFQGEPNLRLNIVQETKKLLQELSHETHRDTYLVMHGSSAVPREVVDEINRYVILRVNGDDIEFMRSLEVERDGKKGLEFERTRRAVYGMSRDAQNALQNMARNKRLPYASGVPTEIIQEAIAYGIRKVNVDTDGRLAVTAAVLRELYENPKNFDPRKYLGAGRDEIHKWVAQEMWAFGSAGHAGDYKPKTLKEMKAFYGFGRP